MQKKILGPNDELKYVPTSKDDNEKLIYVATQINKQTIKSSLGNLELDNKCKDNCVSDCSCVNDVCHWVIN